ncbi:unnamed protein product [Onchocerca flexuosa]|uniref:Uncharacterized protein n=1 Tax=Onchocerca flexuosa TaxID=387005 RepID=A0A183H1G7_9BILA|nr:unnamed protein product [Onchocerca flexuosa]
MSSSQQHTALDRKDYLNCTARTSTTSHKIQQPSTQACHNLLGADSPIAIHGGRASLGSIIRGTKGHLSSILGSVTQWSKAVISMIDACMHETSNLFNRNLSRDPLDHSVSYCSGIVYH